MTRDVALARKGLLALFTIYLHFLHFFEAYFDPCRILPDKNQLILKDDRFLRGPRRAFGGISRHTILFRGDLFSKGAVIFPQGVRVFSKIPSPDFQNIFLLGRGGSTPILPNFGLQLFRIFSKLQGFKNSELIFCYGSSFSDIGFF